jgi:hypothetical protein
MNGPVADLENVTGAILHEIQGVMGLAGHRRLARLVGSLFQPSARHLPSIAPHFIPISEDPYRRMAAVRAALQHLLDGRALLIFPRGDVEIDPALSPQALEGISRWSPSLELFLRRAPRASLVIATVGGVLSARWFNHPILRLWKKTEQRQKVAEIIQVAEQLILSRKPQLSPLVYFSPPLTFSGIDRIAAPPGRLMQILAQAARSQMAALNANFFG